MAIMVSGCGVNNQEDRNVVKVKVAEMSPASLSGLQSYAGTIEEESGTTLSFSGAGTIRRFQVSEGQYVNQGDVVATIDATSIHNGLEVAKAATSQAEEMLNQAQDAYARMKMLHDNGSLSEIKWVEVQTKLSQAQSMVKQAKASEEIARKGVSDTRLVAPFSGYISQKSAEVGQNVLPGIPVAKLVRIDRVKVLLSVPEVEIAKVQIGSEVHFRVASLGDATFVGKITEKGVTADGISRAYQVKALVQNPDHRLLPGMICDASIQTDAQANGLALPANLVQIDFKNRSFVWIMKEGKARKAFVQTGANIGDKVQITGGLRLGDLVIVEGQHKVSEGMEVES